MPEGLYDRLHELRELLRSLSNECQRGLGDKLPADVVPTHEHLRITFNRIGHLRHIFKVLQVQGGNVWIRARQLGLLSTANILRNIKVQVTSKRLANIGP